MTIITIAQLTIREAQRRKILWAALLMGILFLLVFGIGLHLIWREMTLDNPYDAPEMFEVPANFLTMAGLYVTNFLVVIMAVLISVASISGEIESHLVDILITKPMNRRDLIVGKWLGFGVMTTLYTFMLGGGVLLISRLVTGLTLRQPIAGISLIALNALVMLTVSIAGGTRLSTLANGVVAFMLYGLAFVGGWVEAIGGLFRNETAVNLGIVSSLLLPVEALWRKAAIIFQPRMTGSTSFAGPFVVTNEPSDVMVVYAVVYIVGLLAFALWSFQKRDM